MVMFMRDIRSKWFKRQRQKGYKLSQGQRNDTRSSWNIGISKEKIQIQENSTALAGEAIYNDYSIKLSSQVDYFSNFLFRRDLTLWI